MKGGKNELKSFGKGARRKAAPPPVLAGSGFPASRPFPAIDSYTPLADGQYDLYRSLVEAVPVIDAAVQKLVRLTGSFSVSAEDERYDGLLRDFIETVPSDAGGVSLWSFLDSFFKQLLLFGTAVGEMLTDENGSVRFLYVARPEDVCLKRDPNDFSHILVCRNSLSGAVPAVSQEKTLFAALDPEPGRLCGTSILKGLPFVSSVLLKIFNATGQNWDRVGNLRFAVTYKPGEDLSSKAYAKERAEKIAREWSETMKSGSVKDFIAVGDVGIRVIGADAEIPDSEIPVRQLLEQIVAKLGIPPFLLGLSWSTTERMSAVQADVLTTELWHYRRHLTPIIRKICRTQLRSRGYTGNIFVDWDEITLQDKIESAKTELYLAQAEAIRKEDKND